MQADFAFEIKVGWIPQWILKRKLPLKKQDKHE